MLTAYADDDTILSALRAGARDCTRLYAELAATRSWPARTPIWPT
ncbi:MAG: hypothetical protein ACM3ML_01520 [Micromonosporaceae bacterium]